MIYKFENIEVDKLNFRLLKDGQVIPIEPQVFDLLVYLIDNRERLVTRHEILDKIWQDREVSDTALSNLIKLARKAIDDDGHQQRIISTVHGRGYQFIIEVSIIDCHSNGSHSPSKSFKVKPIVISLMILVALFTTNYFYSNKEPVDDLNNSIHDTEIRQKSIAVLAFSDLSVDQNQQYFAEGITEELLNYLSKISELRVISRTSSFSYKNKNLTLGEIGKQLNVSHILEGSVRASKDKLRITVQLIQVSNDDHLWSETYEFKFEDIFIIQDAIARSVVKQLHSKILEPRVSEPSIIPEAYNLYLEAKYNYQLYTDDSIVLAEVLIRESLEIDPNYAPSWFLFSKIVYRASSNLFHKQQKEGLLFSEELVNKSLELDPTYALSYAHLSILNISKREYENSKVNIDKALSLDGGNSSIIATAAGNAMDSGRLNEAIRLFKKAIKLDPLTSVNYYNLGIVLLWTNRMVEAEQAMRQYHFLRPEGAAQHATMSSILLWQGRFEEAFDEAEKETHPFWKLLAQSYVHHSLNNHKLSDELLKQFIEKYSKTNPTVLASIYAHRGEIDNAFKWLETALVDKKTDLVTRINFSSFRYLHDDPRWENLISRINLPKSHWLRNRHKDD